MLGDTAGSSTVEAALAIASLVSVLLVCVAGLAAIGLHLRCIDAAREAARLAARGDESAAVAVAQQIAPSGSTVQLRRDGPVYVATVTAHPTILAAVSISATGIAAAEP
ncbi:TadE family type IV pilus minor pilin [Mycolicibacillus koreensis]|uniref:Apoptosis inhibitor n=1 Tax=Mycolicibacillus koreensis TaxID=1069220 RepID=A0AA91SRN3_9MYCO|nr:TadE family type IV pilus minor pilin [Mycolicibacillus koreensis]OSC33710.1 hypothetical protein B8W67_09860 [Mycolicibacillus koreensis]